MGMGFLATGPDRGETMIVSQDKARDYAQVFLDRTQPGNDHQ